MRSSSQRRQGPHDLCHGQAGLAGVGGLSRAQFGVLRTYRDGWEWSPYMPKPERSDTTPSTPRYRVPLTTPVATWDAPMWVVRVVYTAAESDMASAGYHGRLRAPPRKWLLRRGGLLAHNARGWAGPGRVVHEAPVERLWRYAIQEVDVWMSTGRTRSDGAPHRVAKLYHSRLPTEARIGLWAGREPGELICGFGHSRANSVNREFMKYTFLLVSR